MPWARYHIYVSASWPAFEWHVISKQSGPLAFIDPIPPNYRLNGRSRWYCANMHNSNVVVQAVLASSLLRSTSFSVQIFVLTVNCNPYNPALLRCLEDVRMFPVKLNWQMVKIALCSTLKPCQYFLNVDASNLAPPDWDLDCVLSFSECQQRSSGASLASQRSEFPQDVKEFICCFCFLQVTTPFTLVCTCPRVIGGGGATVGKPATRTERRGWRRTSLTSRTQKTTMRPATASSNLSVSSDGLRVKAG